MRSFFLSFFLLWIAVPVSLKAETVKQAHTEVELIADTASLTSGMEFRAGILFKMEPGWHIYWKNPGDSGLPPEIQWQLPSGFSAGPVQWPYPHLLQLPPLTSYGYENEILLAAKLKAPETLKAGEIRILKTTVHWLACEVDCIPGKAELSLTLPVTEKALPEIRWAKLFASTRFRLPLEESAIRFEAVLSGKKINLSLFPSPQSPSPEKIYFFSENSALVRHAETQKVTQAQERITLEIPLSSNHPPVDRLRGVLVSEKGWRGDNSEKALIVDIPLAKSSGLPASSLEPVSLAAAVFFAFLGGLILNLMPCVLPVLSLKIMNFVREAAESPEALLKHGVIFSTGVLVSFWTLAGMLMVLKAAGNYAGWGFQLQSPGFLVVLIFIFFLFSLNLFGVFEVGASFTALGQPLARRHGFAASFFNGVFAVAAATPCTAPFMGTALGFSLSQPPAIALTVFTSLALGMAFPYLLLCSQPGLLRFIPKPGPWMAVLKELLGFPLIAAALWLLWVLSLQRGTGAVLWVVSGLGTAAFGAWLLGKAPFTKTHLAAMLLRAAAVLFFAAGLAAGFRGTNLAAPSPAAADVSNAGIPWEPYSAEKVDSLRAQGRIVFIDFTAAWCLTCKVNERAVLETTQVADALKKAGAACLKADWTSRDPAITQALASFGRNSIPLYVLYGPGASKPVLLPELLTPSIVLKALEALKKSESKTV